MATNNKKQARLQGYLASAIRVCWLCCVLLLSRQVLATQAENFNAGVGPLTNWTELDFPAINLGFGSYTTFSFVNNPFNSSFAYRISSDPFGAGFFESAGGAGLATAQSYTDFIASVDITNWTSSALTGMWALDGSSTGYAITCTDTGCVLDFISNGFLLSRVAQVAGTLDPANNYRIVFKRDSFVVDQISVSVYQLHGAGSVPTEVISLAPASTGLSLGSMELSVVILDPLFIGTVEADFDNFFVAADENADADSDGLPNNTELANGLDPFFVDESTGDLDADGLTNAQEISNGTLIADADSDDDGLNDGDEVNTYGSNPLASDTDSDNLDDADEIALGTGILNPDTDTDTLSDGDEVNLYGTNPLLSDTDTDGLSDSQEINTTGTNPLLADSDSDGLDDNDELTIYFTDPALPDTDTDGLNDGAEIAQGTDPLAQDSDGDNLLDGFEVANGFDPLGTNEAALDPDTDGLDNLAEQAAGTDPNSSDTDGDGLLDLFEVTFGFDPVGTDESAGDADTDGVSNIDEQTAGTNPQDNDTDGDGLLDGFELLYGFDALSTDESLLDNDTDGLNNLEEQSNSTNPLLGDSDSDGLSDFDEINTHSTDPNSSDTDADGFSDGDEILAGSDPSQASQTPFNIFQKVVEPTPGSGNLFGNQVAIDGDYAAVASQGNKRVYVYERSGGVWTLVETLFGVDNTVLDAFGSALALQGNTLVVGAQDDAFFCTITGEGACGSLQVYTRDVAGNWLFSARLGATNYRIGDAIDIDGDILIAGASKTDCLAGDDCGAAAIFLRSGGAWGNAQIIDANFPETGARFGDSVAVSGSNAIIGAWGDNHSGFSEAGAAFIFRRTSTGWTQAAKLVADLPAADDFFGWRVALDGNTAVIGALGRDVTGLSSGAAFIFEQSEGLWQQTAQLVPADNSANDALGFAVDIDNNTVVIGAQGAEVGTTLGAGKIYVYSRTNNQWSQQQLVGETTTNGFLGNNVAVSGTTVLAGLQSDDIPPDLNTGSALFFDIDADDDGMTNSFELAQSLDPLSAADALLDFDADGLSNLEEQQAGTSPYIADTDADGYTDGVEVTLFSDPVNIAITPSFNDYFGSNTSAGDEFGFSIAIDNNTAAIGAPRTDQGGIVDAGSVYIFTQSGGVWTEEAILNASIAQNNYRFGASVALSGDILWVGSPGLMGEAYVFERSGGTWGAPQMVQGSDTALFDQFGEAVAVDGNRAVVGAPAKNCSGDIDNPPIICQGSAYVFVDNGSSWSQEAILSVAVPANLIGFGSAVTISGDTLMVGQNFGNAAYVFNRSGSSWIEAQQLVGSDTVAGDRFGSSLALLGNDAVIGAPYHHNVTDDSGAVYRFEYSGSWTQADKLTASDNDANDYFGTSVALDGMRILVGARGDDAGSIDAGAAYLFTQNGGLWTQREKLFSQEWGFNDQYGHAVAVDGDLLALSSRLANGVGSASGGLYFYFDDEDFDLVFASVDNCPQVFNTAQLNNEGDALGDVCDLDDDFSFAPGFGKLDLTPPPLAVAPDQPLTPFNYIPDVGYSGPYELCFEVNNLPSWASFNAVNGNISGAPSNDDYGLYSGITLQATEVLVEPASGASDCLAAMPIAGGQSLESLPFDLSVQDNRPPLVIATPAGATSNATIPVTLTCIETIGSGCSTIYYDFNTTASDSSPNSVDISGSGFAVVNVTTSTSLHFIAEDAAGNDSAEGVAAFTIDAGPPTLSIDSPTGPVTFTTATLIGSVDDSDSGVAGVDLVIDDTPRGGSTNQTLTTATVKTTGSCSGHNGDGVTPVSVPAPCWEATYVPVSGDGTIAVSVTAFDNAGNSTGAALVFDNFTGSAQFTTLDLGLSSNSILFNGEVDAALKLSVPGNPAVDLSGQSVSLTITPPAGSATPPTIINRTTNSDGQISLLALGDGSDIVFDEKGAWSVSASYSGALQYAAASSATEALLVGTSAGYAVLIQGKASTSEGLDSHNKTLNRVYDTLKRRNFADQNIFYFNYDASQDVDGDGVPDNIFADGKGIDADVDLVGKAGIQNQIQNLYFAMNANPAPLYIVMIDHGNTDGSSSEFLIDNALDGNVSITPTELDSWLDVLESNLTGGAELEPRVIINGSCYSGGFIEPLTGVNGTVLASPRIVISSSAADEVSYKGPLESDGIRVGEYFIEELFESLDQGNNFLAAFNVATAKTEVFTRESDSTAINGQYLDTAVQHPLLDDNNDGVGSNFIEDADTASTVDGNLAKTLFLGTSVQSATNSLAVPAAVIRTNETIILPAGSAPADTTASLLLEANDNGEVAVALVEIRAPATALQGGDLSGSGVTEQLEADALTRLFLNAPATVGCAASEFCLDEPSFITPGKYELYYYVEDLETGAVSPAARALVYKRKLAEIAPNAFDLLSPVDMAQLGSDVAIFRWNSSADDDGLTYTLRVCDDMALTSNCRVIEEISANFQVVNGLADLATYYWAVDAVDSFGAVTTSSSTRQFTTLFDNNIVGVVQGFVQASNDFSFLSSHSVSRPGAPLEYATATTDEGGVYALLTLAGTVSIEASATGYDTAGKTVVIPAGETVNANFLLAASAPPVDTDMDGIPDAIDTDDDNDGMPDEFENMHAGLNPLVNDALGDLDSDGLLNIDEFLLGFDPTVADNEVQIPMPVWALYTLFVLMVLAVARMPRGGHRSLRR